MDSIVAPVVPHLPAEDVRQALDRGDWPQAAELLAMHQHELKAALSHVDWQHTNRGPWLDLLLAQRALLGELQDARIRVSAALTRLNEDHRGARAWLRELA